MRSLKDLLSWPIRPAEFEVWCRMSQDETLWHKCSAPLFARGIHFFLPHGQTWRRRSKDGKWEYRQDEEAYDAWLDRQW